MSGRYAEPPPEADKSWETFVQNPVRIEARQVTEDQKVKIGGKRLPVKAGDWVVRFPSGIKKRYRDEQFRELFSFVGTTDSKTQRSDPGPPGVAL